MGVPSHLVKDKTGEPILHRIVRQVRELDNSSEVMIVGPKKGHEKYHVPGSLFVSVDQEYPNEYFSTYPYWSTEGRTVLLLGDTYFTDEDISRIVLGDDPGFKVFGRQESSEKTGTSWGEIFASSWWEENNPMVYDHMIKVSEAFKAKRIHRQCGWEVLYSIQGLDLTKPQENGHCPHVCDPEYFINIDSLTDDIDYPIDYARHPMFGGNK